MRFFFSAYAYCPSETSTHQRFRLMSDFFFPFDVFFNENTCAIAVLDSKVVYFWKYAISNISIRLMKTELVKHSDNLLSSQSFYSSSLRLDWPVVSGLSLLNNAGENFEDYIFPLLLLVPVSSDSSIKIFSTFFYIKNFVIHNHNHKTRHFSDILQKALFPRGRDMLTFRSKLWCFRARFRSHKKALY